jgi:hypothetical protein
MNPHVGSVQRNIAIALVDSAGLGQGCLVHLGPLREVVTLKGEVVAVGRIEDGGESGCVWREFDDLSGREAHPHNDLILFDRHALKADLHFVVGFLEWLLVATKK